MTTTTYSMRPLTERQVMAGQPVIGSAPSMTRVRSIDAVTTGSHATGLSFAGAVTGAFGTRDDAKGLPPRGAPV